MVWEGDKGGEMEIVERSREDEEGKEEREIEKESKRMKRMKGEGEEGEEEEEEEEEEEKDDDDDDGDETTPLGVSQSARLQKLNRKLNRVTTQTRTTTTTIVTTTSIYLLYRIVNRRSKRDPFQQNGSRSLIVQPLKSFITRALSQYHSLCV
ncbi:hypothetical protein HZH68_001696 [Vespula germanica]|uniref:Uncharacterized protein n=1 Tax=Vespula germanica TaxID=30212 RepID=A0A834U756_VESGE|nr:hypothetical protein HZH68_001696 [Vespula germanica]